MQIYIGEKNSSRIIVQFVQRRHLEECEVGVDRHGLRVQQPKSTGKGSRKKDPLFSGQSTEAFRDPLPPWLIVQKNFFFVL